ncbi:hypothetical protein VB711_15260 [Cronbergia sp. UHCC 0137]|uniref:hypothetical protein n=1 Tax=Cronbergia sp. UHCC 0137 TaxID=3110239 RepID=UPI002B1E932D|nr:hypothetical protein [Cronbergia sp. UHCC 0137]MEA5619186.1 hypothetical protein [Cronbergia sp. UHCC 0137]
MNAHKIEIVLTENGQLILENLPFKKGESVEVIILEHRQLSSNFNSYPLAGKVIQYDEPYEPATDIEDWEVLK